MKTILNPETRELRRLSRIYLLEGLIAAGMFHAAMIGGLSALMRHLDIDDSLPPVLIDRPIDWVDIGGFETPVNTNPSPAQPRPNVFVNNAIPNIVPVFEEEEPDSLKPEDVTIPGTGEPGDGTPITGSSALSGTFFPGGGEEREPERFTPVEKEPVALLAPAPAYPDIAVRAGLEGIVYVKMWVGRDGSVKRAEVVKSNSEIFNDAALNAANRWRFSPAIMNQTPVSVWVTVPFRFRLNSK